MTIHLSTRASCDLCGKPATVSVEPDLFLCAECASFDPDSEVPVEQGTAPVAAIPAPGHCMAAGASNPVAKATEGKAGTAGIKGPVRRSSAWMGLRVGEADADRSSTSVTGVTGRRDVQPISNSGDVLGDHKPGSITSGERAALTAGSGRAHNCAKCPDVTGILSPPDVVPLPVLVETSATSAAARPPLAAAPFSSSNAPADSIPVGPREGRLSERLPAFSAGTASADNSRAFKAVVSRTFSPDPEAPRPTDVTAAAGFQQMSAAVDLSDFETEVSALEAEWLDRGICMNATTFLVSVMSDSKSKSEIVGA